MDLGIESKSFIETVLKLHAGSWGNVDDFLILEHEGKPIAAAAGIEAGEAFARGPIALSQIDTIGIELGWSNEVTDLFRERYSANWPDPQGNFLLLPQASWIIESVAVVPAERGKGLVKPLMKALFDKGRQRGHSSVGITVANGNVSAQKAYERMGFQMYVSFGPAFFGEEGFNGYTKYKMQLP
jgi:ribosomal protein S18 acetylase RimI-like enzyme